jgi:hypothetical protein
MREIGVSFSLKGILGVESGNNGEDNYYRCLYYATTELTQETSTIAFRNYDEIEELKLLESEKVILKEVSESKKVYSL